MLIPCLHQECHQELSFVEVNERVRERKGILGNVNKETYWHKNDNN